MPPPQPKPVSPPAIKLAEPKPEPALVGVVKPDPVVVMPEPVIKPPTVKQQSWGTIVSLVLIILMIVVGAFYAWGKRISEEQQYQNSFPAAASSTAQ